MHDSSQVQPAQESGRLYPVHVFKSVATQRPISSGRLSASELVAQLRRVKKCDSKNLAPLVTLVDYRPGASSRAIADIDRVWAIYGDIDHGFDADLFEHGMRELEGEGAQVIAHQTYNHSTEAPRWRVYVLLDEPIAPAKYRACWDGLNAMFGGMLDGNAKDPARLNYWPSCPPGGSREVRTINLAEAA